VRGIRKQHCDRQDSADHPRGSKTAAVPVGQHSMGPMHLSPVSLGRLTSSSPVILQGGTCQNYQYYDQ
jgi:hypothetical protein